MHAVRNIAVISASDTGSSLLVCIDSMNICGDYLVVRIQKAKLFITSVLCCNLNLSLSSLDNKMP